MSQDKPSQSDSDPRPGVSIAVFRDSQVLLVQRTKPPFEKAWTLPGGHIQPGEQALMAAHRELLEETGTRADLLGVSDIVDVILRRDDGSLDRHYVLAVYYGRWRGGEAKAADDVCDLRWVEVDQLENQELTKGAHRAILDAYARLSADSMPPTRAPGS